MTSVTQKIIVSSGKIFLLQGVGILMGFGLQAFISNVTGAAGLGGYTLFVSWLAILAVLTIPGLEGTLVYFLPRLDNDSAARERVVNFCVLGVGGVTLVVALAILGAHGSLFARVGLPKEARLPFAMALVFFSLGKLLESVFLGMKDAVAISFYNVIRTALRFVFCLPLFLFPAAKWQILFFAIALECLLTLWLRAARIRKQYPGLLRPHLNRVESGQVDTAQLLAVTMPMFGISMVDNLYPFMDKAILGAMLSIEFVGIYRVSESVASLSSLFVAPFVSFWPYISKLYKENRISELGESYRTINLVIIACMIPFVLFLIELSKFVLAVFGPTFVQHGYHIFLVMVLGFVVDAAAGPAGAVLRMTNHSRLAFFINLTLLGLYITLSLLLARRFGLIGVAMAKMLVMVLGNIVNVSANAILLRVFPYSWNHAWLLLCGIGILAIRNFAPISASTLFGHFCIGLGEVGLFACGAYLIMHRQIPSLKGTVLGMYSGNRQ